jgi:hypothetical protein
MIEARAALYPRRSSAAAAVLVVLARHLLQRRQHGLDLAEVDEHVARVLALLHDLR